MATIAPEVPVLARDEAFEQLYRRYVTDVYHYALALLRNSADAEDVTQTTFLNAYRAFQRGEEIRKPQNWLIKIAHNVARSRYARISRRVKEVPLEDHADYLASPEEERPNIEGVLRALGRLPFNQRAALVMRELEGRSYREIADTLDVSVPAVETLIFRARRSLRLRTAALRSILAVPLPSSLAQFVEGGGGAAGGVGAGLLIKAALALVVGGLATGIGVERGNRATAAPSTQAPPPTAAHAAAATVRGTVGTTSTHRTNTARHAVARHARAAGLGIPARSSSSPTASVSQQPAAAAAAHASTPTPQAPAAAGVVSTTVQTAQTVVDTVEQTAAAVTAALPVSVPQVPPLPVQAPQLPKLP